MGKVLLLLGTAVLASLGFRATMATGTQDKAKDAQAGSSENKIPQEDIDKKNPVKPTPEGLAGARRMYSYDCAMCHGTSGDGKGDLAESMKLTLHDWRDPASIANMTDGELFYIISNGKGKMTSEKERCSEAVRWNLVNLVRSFSAKGAAEKPSS